MHSQRCLPRLSRRTGPPKRHLPSPRGGIAAAMDAVGRSRTLARLQLQAQPAPAAIRDKVAVGTRIVFFSAAVAGL
eukprot:8695884-Pyramimonas_sp.AAC.1